MTENQKAYAEIEKRFLEGVIAAFQSPKRIEFPTHEHDYDLVHREIHNALEACIEGFKVGCGDDVLVAGRNPYTYNELYGKVFFSTSERETFLQAKGECQLGLITSTYTVSKFAELVLDGHTPLLVARVLHDAVHHLILYARGEGLGQLACQLRPRMFSAYYQLKAVEGTGNTFLNLPEIGPCHFTDDDVSEMMKVCEQIELDVGLARELIFNEK